MNGVEFIPNYQHTQSFTNDKTLRSISGKTNPKKISTYNFTHEKEQDLQKSKEKFGFFFESFFPRDQKNPIKDLLD